MIDTLNSIQHGDCIEGMNLLEAGSVDLAFADPPFNIGYDYDVYNDSLEHEKYVEWSKEWIAAVYRVLKSDGTFWLAIGDEYAAELKLASQAVGFHCRSWVIWYYTFGVNCSHKFSRSHAHLFYFVKDPKQFTFRSDDLDNRIPSARQLVYNDKRANPNGRLPDDTWIIRPRDIVGEFMTDDGYFDPKSVPPPTDDKQTWTLRPQDLEQCFSSSEDTWYFPRVAGTFKERAGFHGCQMPEQLLGRIIRSCSSDNDVVLDPFSGSATTLAVAKKLGRRYLGFDLSEDYITYGEKRLSEIRVGDRLEGSPEPTMSAPKTGENHNRFQSKKRRKASSLTIGDNKEDRYDEAQLAMTLTGVAEAFRICHDGYSADRVVADPDLNASFSDICKTIGIFGDVSLWNRLLFRLRKSGKLSHIGTTRRTAFSWQSCDSYLFASEIAWQQIQEKFSTSLDEILCDPVLATEFDNLADRFAPGFSKLEYRWAALKLRKRAKVARVQGAILSPPKWNNDRRAIFNIDFEKLPEASGIYLLRNKKQTLYAGETFNLKNRLNHQLNGKQREEWVHYGKQITLQMKLIETNPSTVLAWQSCLTDKLKPLLNFRELTLHN